MITKYTKSHFAETPFKYILFKWNTFKLSQCFKPPFIYGCRYSSCQVGRRDHVMQIPITFGLAVIIDTIDNHNNQSLFPATCGMFFLPSYWCICPAQKKINKLHQGACSHSPLLPLQTYIPSHCVSHLSNL